MRVRTTCHSYPLRKYIAGVVKTLKKKGNERFVKPLEFSYNGFLV